MPQTSTSLCEIQTRLETSFLFYSRRLDFTLYRCFWFCNHHHLNHNLLRSAPIVTIGRSVCLVCSARVTFTISRQKSLCRSCSTQAKWRRICVGDPFSTLFLVSFSVFDFTFAQQMSPFKSQTPHNSSLSFSLVLPLTFIGLQKDERVPITAEIV
jgi:hypothetical protein